MGIASFLPFSGTPALSALLAPLQAVLALFIPPQSAAASDAIYSVRSSSARAAARLAKRGSELHETQATGRTQPARSVAPSRLRVLREFEPGVAPSLAGRMVISGRMADVCAELERMSRA